MSSISAPDYGEAGEARLRDFVHSLGLGRIVRMDRQVRWRPAWFVDVETPDGTVLPLHLRGDREGDVAIFPDLRRESDIIQVLGEQGIHVPRIYGFCEDPPCIVMDALAGSRDMGLAASDAERRSIGRDYLAQVAAMHQLPLEPFVAIGMHRPDGAEAIALEGLGAYMPLYSRTKGQPEPLIEFVIGWLRRNIPTHRTKASFIQFDSGQFLHENGKMTGLYDFEFSMIGDPLFDIATLRMRDSAEPIGSELKSLLKAYEEFTGEPIDHDVVDYYTLMFSTLACMQFAGTVSKGVPADPHDLYMSWDLALRQKVLESLSALMGVTRAPEPPPRHRAGDNAATIAKLTDMVGRLEASSPLQETTRRGALDMLGWLERSDAMGAEMRARDLTEIAAITGHVQAEWTDAQGALEAFVLAAGPEQDEALLRLFGRMQARRMHMFSATAMGQNAVRAVLTPTR